MRHSIAYIGLLVTIGALCFASVAEAQRGRGGGGGGGGVTTVTVTVPFVVVPAEIIAPLGSE